jgi:hypothetical protein
MAAFAADVPPRNEMHEFELVPLDAIRTAKGVSGHATLDATAG